jgi:hypothetical protein
MMSDNRIRVHCEHLKILSDIGFKSENSMFSRSLEAAEINAILDHIEARRELGLKPDAIERETLVRWHRGRHGDS